MHAAPVPWSICWGARATRSWDDEPDRMSQAILYYREDRLKRNPFNLL
jgi:hypothetical protein